MSELADGVIKAYQSIEDFVGAHSASDVKRHYAVACDKDDWETAIKTHIAIGERMDLENTFPEWSGCNPANHDWS